MLKIEFYIFIIFISILKDVAPKTNNQQNVVIDNINDIKDLKKLFRTKTNMLVMFISNLKETQSNVKIFRESAEIVKGQGTMVLIDCSVPDKKKLCKKLKVTPQPYHLKHYKDGEFNKDYDRQMIISSMVNFMRDPTGDLPWQEDPKGVNVLHITDVSQLTKLLKKELKPILIMFYAPWCSFCKQLKPEYSDAATELKGRYIMAAMDVDRPENSIARRQYNITGFPTMLYFENGKMKYTYEGENKKGALISFMENPTAPPITKPKEDDWSADTSSEIVHLTTAGFEPALKDEKSVLVMFYAPWCGHCKRMKPEYEKAAIQMKNEKIPGVLAALDATKETSIGQEYGVKGYPTVKYFVNGEFKFDVNVRDAEKIVNFMKDPKEPPPPPPPEKSWDEEQSEVEHLNDETFKIFLKKKKHALVMFYAPWCGHCKKAKPEFTAAAEEFKEDPRIALAAIDCTKYASVCSIYEVRGYPTFKYFSYLKTVTDYSGGRLTNDFIKYLKNPNNDNTATDTNDKVFGDNILHLNDNNFNIIGKTIEILFVMFYVQDSEKSMTGKHFFNKAAEKLNSSHKQIKLAAVDCTVNIKLKAKYNIENIPKYIVFRNGEMITNYSGPSKTDNFIEYITQYENIKDEL